MKFLRCILPLLGLASALAPAADSVPTNRPAAAANPAPTLPTVFLQAKEQIRGDARVPCTARLGLPGATGGADAAALPGQVRFHGATSQGYPKKSFALGLDAPARWLGLPPKAHWVLNAAAVDRSLMRHKLSYDLFLSLSSPGGPRFAAASRFVELELNGRYQGVYLLMQRVDGALLGFRPFDSNAPSHACIYKAVDHAADFSQPNQAGFEQREPDPLVREYWQPLEEFNRFASRAKGEDFFQPQTGIESRLDVAATIDFHLLVLLTSNMDGNDKNFIFARNAPTAETPKPRFFFVPWDYDATFGRNWEASRVSPNAWLSNHLFDRLLSNPAYRERFAARWRQLRAREFAVPVLQRLMDDNARTLGAAVQRNASRWSSMEGHYPDRLTFEEDVRQMKQWVVARTGWLDAEIARRCGERAAAR